MSQLSEDLQKQLQKGVDDLRTLRDDIKVRLHLAGMEAKTRWNEELEPRFFELERKAREAGDKAGEAARHALTTAWSELLQTYHSFADSLTEKPAQKSDAEQTKEAKP